MCALLGALRPSSTSHLPGDCQSALMAAMLTSFAQERRCLDFAQIVGGPESGNPSSQMTVMDQIQRQFDTLTRASSPSVPQEQIKTIQSDRHNIHNLLTILRFIPQRTLYAFSRFRTSPAGSAKARNDISEHMHRHMEQARDCLLHAAQLYQSLRQASPLLYHDPFLLLNASIYIWAYTELVEHAPATISNANSPNKKEKTIRIDQVLDGASRDDWVFHGSGRQAHITGVGILGDDRSTTRLLKETSRILSANGDKLKLPSTLATLFESALEGQYHADPDD